MNEKINQTKVVKIKESKTLGKSKKCSFLSVAYKEIYIKKKINKDDETHHILAPKINLRTPNNT